MPGAIPRRAAELVPPVGWRVAATGEVLSGPALVGRPVLFHVGRPMLFHWSESAGPQASRTWSTMVHSRLSGLSRLFRSSMLPLTALPGDECCCRYPEAPFEALTLVGRP